MKAVSFLPVKCGGLHMYFAYSRGLSGFISTLHVRHQLSAYRWAQHIVEKYILRALTSTFETYSPADTMPEMDLSSPNGTDDITLSNGQPSKSAKTPHICIVGAGISGLRCASELLDHGFKVTILEARDRIGGRVCQSDELGYTVDIGPNWIHTSGHNPILDLATATGTPLHIWNEKVQVFDQNGGHVDEETAKRLGELRWSIIEEAIGYSKENMHSIDKDDSLGQWFETRVKQMDLPEYDKKILIGMAEMWGCYIGDPIHRQSLKYTWLEDCCNGGEY